MQQQPALRTPVALILFNRPETTKRVLEAIRQVRPCKLYVIADGPRPTHGEDLERCRAARAVLDLVDWPCEVVRNFAEGNLGCGARFVSGADWLFAHEEQAILLEDDCVPVPSFFYFCQALLERYRDDPRVMMIGGDNFQAGQQRAQEASYYFSQYVHTWGWATWRRAWQLFDPEVKGWPTFDRAGRLREHCETARERRYWRKRFAHVYRGAPDIWDYQWTFACWAHHGLCAVPEQNLVTNIGVASSATHVAIEDESVNRLPARDMWEIEHPARVERHIEADRFMFRTVYGGTLRRVLNYIRRGYVSAGTLGALRSTAQLAGLTLKLLRSRAS